MTAEELLVQLVDDVRAALPFMTAPELAPEHGYELPGSEAAS